MSSEVKEEVCSIGLVCASDRDFKRKVLEICGENVLSCYQCGECTAGCPVAHAMDIAPNQVMRMAQLGMADELLASSTIWLCAGCETCATRCPRQLALSKVMDACRQIAIKSGKGAKERNVLSFHEEFLKEVARNGRIHEITLIGMYKMRSKKFFDDIFAGLQMFLKGKLGLIPHRVKGLGEVRGLFSESRKGERAKDAKG